jgi:MinD-like ATPase involved in chromosome partitioning or flagellar assembly
VTPDRPEPTPDEPENGVLSDTGSVDTTGLGILGGATAQVNVELPTESDDDLADDDVIDDEVPFVVEIPAEAVEHGVPFVVELPADTAEAEIVPDAALDEWTIEDGGIASDYSGEDITDADVVFDDDERIDVVDALPIAEPADEVESADEFGLGDPFRSHDEFADDEVVDAVMADGHTGTDHAAEEDMDASTPAGDQAGAAASVPETAAPAATTPASAPASRRSHAADPVAPQERAMERVAGRPDVTLTSKRLGEFEVDRETADLLTADRLLDPHHVVRSEPEGLWQHLLYSITGRRLNLGDSKRARARKELDRRIAAPLNGGARFVPVLSRKGGVGKTTVTTLMGMALADARDDRVIAVDANPDRGTLAERISKTSGKTVRDLIRSSGDVVGFNNLSNIVARDETRLDVVASDSDPRVSEAFNDVDYRDVAALAAHYYSIVLTDTGTGIVHSVMGATLDLADQLVIVAGLSVDEARLASETLTWLETNGHADKVRGAVVVLNNARPGNPLVRLDELEAHFRTRVRAVVRVPYDPQIAAGSSIVFRDLQPETRQAARELAATVVEGLRSLASAA